MSKPILAYPTLEHAGRLGNQLWQIASTVGMALDRNMQPRFPENWSYRPFFSCPDDWFGPIQPKDATSWPLATRLDRRCRPYLQDLSLWRHHQDVVRAAFQPSEIAKEAVMWQWAEGIYGLPGPVCALHIRRGDYATNPLGTVTSLPLSYYENALDVIHPASVVVFSDDIPWCRENFLRGDLYFEGVPRTVEQDPTYRTAPVLDWIDLFLQMSCANAGSIVISNSTFSWWAAWLAESCERIVYPSRWFGRDMAKFINFRAMIPDDKRWTELRVFDA